MTEELVRHFGSSVAQIAGADAPLKVAVCRDTRASGPGFERSLSAGLCEGGADVQLLGVLPTSCAAKWVRDGRADIGIAITASHNPPLYNGLKVFGPNGEWLSSTLVADINERMRHPVGRATHAGHCIHINEAQDHFLSLYASIFSFPQKAKRIVVDCANGAASIIAHQAFSMAAEEVIVTGADPDGANINVGCGILEPARARQLVVGSDADVGFVLDGDADRVGVIDRAGHLHDGDAILASLFKAAQRHKRQHTNVVVTEIADPALVRFLRDNNANVFVSDVGDNNVCRTMTQHSADIGGESSGHIVLPSLWPSSDGMVTALSFVSEMLTTGESATALLSSFTPTKRTSFSIPIDRWASVQQGIEEALHEIRLSGRNVIVRRSQTEPVVRLLVDEQDADIIERAAHLKSA